MTDKSLLIPIVPINYTAQDLANILWEHNIAQVSSIYLIPVPYDIKFNSAYIIISNYEDNLNPIINSVLEKIESFIIEIGDDNLMLLNHEQRENPLRETNYPEYIKSEAELMLENDDSTRYLTTFPESYFENRPRASLTISSLNS